MHSARISTFSCLALVAVIGLSGYAFSANYAAVGTCAVPNAVTPAHTYTSIQQAVTASKAGTIIQICPGIYPEQVATTKSMTLEGVISGGQDAAVIVPPTTGMVANTTDPDSSEPMAAQILVQSEALVSILNLTVDGTGSTGNGITGCAPDLVGILFQSASGTINHVAVRNQVLAPGLGGCQSGESIYVQTATGLTSKVTVENTSVHNYNKNGITGNDVGTTLKLSDNYVQGNGVVPSGGAAQNGIQLAFGATGTIVSQTVIDNIYGDITIAASADILIYDTAENSVTVNNNILGNSQLPIILDSDETGMAGDGITVTGNHVFGTSVYDAIDVCSNGNTVTGNTIFNTSESGVHLDASCGGTGKNNVATGNTIIESTCAGILDDYSGTGGNSYGAEIYHTVPFPVAGSAGACPFPAAPAAMARGTRLPSKVSPVGRKR